jgi:hypothetical protein
MADSNGRSAEGARAVASDASMKRRVRRGPPLARLLFIAAAGLLTATVAKSQVRDLDVLRDGQQARLDAAERSQRTMVASRRVSRLAERKLACAQTCAPTGQAVVAQAVVQLCMETCESSTEAAEAVRDFNFQLTAPLFYNSNAEAAASGGSRTLEGNPDLLLSWSKTLGKWKLSGSGDASIDRFGHSASADGDTTIVKTGLRYIGNGHDQNFQPLLGFSQILNFDPTFAHSTSSFHDVKLGFDKIKNYDRNWRPLPTSDVDTSSAAVWSLELTGSVARRIVDQGGANRYIISADPSLTYNLSKVWSLNVSCTVARRIYDSKDGVAQRDWYLQPLLTVTFTPPTSNEALGMPAATLQIGFTKLSSNVASAEFQQWQIGPMLALQWSF